MQAPHRGTCVWSAWLFLGGVGFRFVRDRARGPAHGWQGWPSLSSLMSLTVGVSPLHVRMRAARCILTGSHLGGGFSPFAGLPLPLACECPGTPYVRTTWLACVLVPYRPYVS
eukprot:6589650-Prymnesium_polylepis.1